MSEGETLVTLSGDHFRCYQVGFEYGLAQAYKDSADHAARLERYYTEQFEMLREGLIKSLPANDALQVTVRDLQKYVAPVTNMSIQLRKRAQSHSRLGAKFLGTIQLREKVKTVGLTWMYRVVFPLLLLVLGALTYALVRAG